MENETADYSPSWTKPNDVCRLRSMKLKKRALADRLFSYESPTKKSRGDGTDAFNNYCSKKTNPAFPDESNDSTLMDLLSYKQPVTVFGKVCKPTSSKIPGTSSILQTPQDSPFSKLDALYHNTNASEAFSSPVKAATSTDNSVSPSTNFTSPLRSYLPSMTGTPVGLKTRRLTPTPNPTSPSVKKCSLKSFPGKKKSLSFSNRLKNLEEEEEGKWSDQLCVDWSLKSRVLVTSENPFGWTCNLKASEESSGTCAFVRCINSDTNSQNGSQIDTTLGAQFHQCCLYWQHPYFPTMHLFPRGSNKESANLPISRMLKLDDRALDEIYNEWMESFRSAFNLLRARQCPFFYMCTNQFTMLFCAAGTQGIDSLQIYVTPSTKTLRDSLKAEGIEFTVPYAKSESSNFDTSSESLKDPALDEPSGEQHESDGETDKWLDDMGISQNISLSASFKMSASEAQEEKNRQSLLSIVGKDSLSFFNFLINSKSLLVSNIGQYAGIPPTILAPTAFHGASLRSLKAKQSKVKVRGGECVHSIELCGPILPHVIHSLCALLEKTVESFKIQMTTQKPSTLFNVNTKKNAESSNDKRQKASAFELQNLSDCGLQYSILEKFCLANNCDIINEKIECKAHRYKWL